MKDLNPRFLQHTPRKDLKFKIKEKVTKIKMKTHDYLSGMPSQIKTTYVYLKNIIIPDLKKILNNFAHTTAHFYLRRYILRFKSKEIYLKSYYFRFKRKKNVQGHLHILKIM